VREELGGAFLASQGSGDGGGLKESGIGRPGTRGNGQRAEGPSGTGTLAADEQQSA